MYRRLLVAIDDTDRATTVISHAVDLADTVGARLEAVHIVDISPVYSRYGLASLPSEDEITQQVTQGEQLLEAVQREATNAGVTCHTSLHRGTPHSEIIAHAEETDADAIVIGRPRSRRLKTFFGITTTDRILREADCSVIVVP